MLKLVFQLIHVYIYFAGVLSDALEFAQPVFGLLEEAAY
jgi:hypothetical protein